MLDRSRVPFWSPASNRLKIEFTIVLVVAEMQKVSVPNPSCMYLSIYKLVQGVVSGLCDCILLLQVCTTGHALIQHIVCRQIIFSYIFIFNMLILQFRAHAKKSESYLKCRPTYLNILRDHKIRSLSPRSFINFIPHLPHLTQRSNLLTS